MAWDPTQPVTGAALTSAPMRGNFEALETALMAPLTTAPAHALLKVGPTDTLAAIPATTDGHVLTLVGGVPDWAAPGGGGVTYPLLAPDGSLAAPSYSFAAAPGSGLFRSASGETGLRFARAGLDPTKDPVLTYDWLNTLAQRNGANPQNFRVYSNASDYLEFEAGAGFHSPSAG